jgi:lysophospholipase L1-like esterase
VTLGPARYARYVAIGDSTTEGLDDPDGAGGYRGWANRLAEHVAAAQGSVMYANLAVRGRRTRQVRTGQLAPALAMRPDLATVVAGTNDLLAPGFDAQQVADDLGAMQDALVRAGATVVTFTLPDLAAVIPLARLVSARTLAFNEAVRRVSATTGAVLLDLAARPVASDPRLWSEDRLHANALGHERIAAALAHAIGLPGADHSWAEALPPVPPRGLRAALRAEASWVRRHLAPWIWRHARGRSSGDGRQPKRPTLQELAQV